MTEAEKLDAGLEYDFTEPEVREKARWFFPPFIATMGEIFMSGTISLPIIM